MSIIPETHLEMKTDIECSYCHTKNVTKSFYSADTINFMSDGSKEVETNTKLFVCWNCKQWLRNKKQ